MFMKVKDFQTVASGGSCRSWAEQWLDSGQWRPRRKAEGERTVRAEQQHAGRWTRRSGIASSCDNSGSDCAAVQTRPHDPYLKMASPPLVEDQARLLEDALTVVRQQTVLMRRCLDTPGKLMDALKCRHVSHRTSACPHRC